MTEGEKMTSGKSITVLLPGGRLPATLMGKVGELQGRHGFGLYLSTTQNLRLIDVREEDVELIKSELAAVGAKFKAPGLFPKLKVCVGAPHCNLANVDTGSLAAKVWERFGARTGVKQKLKIVMAACPASCSNAFIADIGIVATRKGYDVYAGGKGGAIPKVGRRIVSHVSEEEVLDVIDRLVAYHDTKTGAKARLSKFLAEPDFPFPQGA